MPEPAELVAFYERAYTHAPADAARHARWRALGARGKADHVIELCARAAVAPASTLEVGCGDGALLSELHRRGFGGRLAGAEITQAAVEIAGARPEIASVSLYDGRHLPPPDAGYELGILSHVLEHVEDPVALLAEVARACRAVVVEVPLEANVSARRSHKRSQADEVGHLQRLDRQAIRRIVSTAGLSIAFELEDALPLGVHVFFARSRSARLAARAKWALRSTLHAIAPSLARRMFTLHYSCIAVPRREDAMPGAGGSGELSRSRGGRRA
jgi:SAM-dependent methyltransferase